MTTASPRAVADALYEAVEAGDVAALDTLFAPDLVDHNPSPGVIDAIDGMRAIVVAVRDGLMDARHEFVFRSETADGWAVTHWIMTGRHTGTFFGTPPSGRDVRFAGIDLARVVDGRITELRHVEELMQLQAQISG